MNIASHYMKIISISALGCLLSVGIADAAQKSKSGMSQDNRVQQDCVDDEDCVPEDAKQPPRKSQQYDNQNAKKKPQANDEGSNRSQANSNWRYDPNRHKRNKYKDQRYEYYYGGYWYPEPYWYVPGYVYRVSCGEGRRLFGTAASIEFGS